MVYPNPRHIAIYAETFGISREAADKQLCDFVLQDDPDAEWSGYPIRHYPISRHE